MPHETFPRPKLARPSTDNPSGRISQKDCYANVGNALLKQRCPMMVVQCHFGTPRQRKRLAKRLRDLKLAVPVSVEGEILPVQQLGGVAWFEVSCGQDDEGIDALFRFLDMTEFVIGYHLPVACRVSQQATGTGPEKVRPSQKPPRPSHHKGDAQEQRKCLNAVLNQQDGGNRPTDGMWE